jgi:formamidopyrimidine-DNA glycosylase
LALSKAAALANLFGAPVAAFKRGAMPELPEVETVRRGLEPHLVGARLTRVIQNRPDLRFPLPPRFAARLTDAVVEALGRRAKYLLGRLDTGETWVTHLGMTGRFTIEAKTSCGGATPGRFHNQVGKDAKHTHLVIETDRGGVITFNDARRFGYMDLIPTEALDQHPWFKGLGPEPLEETFNAKALKASIAGRKPAIKTLLLDQRVVAGLGNIYVSEALNRARIDPRRPAGALKPREAVRLVESVKRVLEEAVAAGGSTLRDYRSAVGELGYFQHSFRVYGRENQPCPDAGCGTVERIVQGGRSTFFCPKCQR